MFYTIYKTTNLINGKFYIGKHQTKVLNDGYMGSGKLIQRAFKKYGIENFAFEYLDIFDQEWKMNLAEKIYVVLDPEVSYNLCPGGQGGFGYINANKLNINTEEQIKKTSIRMRLVWDNLSDKEKEIRIKNLEKGRKESSYIPPIYSNFNTRGRKRPKIECDRISERTKGEKNSQFGTMWIFNDKESIKIRKEDFTEWEAKGYLKGRKIKK